MANATAVTIVVPVYGDWPSLKDCIESLKQFVDPVHQILLINDCGPEVDVLEKKIKNSIEGQKNFIYFRNKKNLGFVGTCNKAVMELDKTNNDILLLNSDTKVTAGFLEEMVGVLNSSSKHGAVSPRSNNATLATIPLSSAAQKGIDPEQSYLIYQKIKLKLPRFYIAPVTHGFCILVKRKLIKEFGLFDEIFGKGYGEEVDFCQRIKKHGYLSIIANHSFVFHLEARSFTLETKAKLLEKNNQIIWRRYPEYRQSVSDYMRTTIDRESKIEQSLGIKQRPKILNKLSILRRFF